MDRGDELSVGTVQGPSKPFLGARLAIQRDVSNGEEGTKQ